MDEKEEEKNNNGWRGRSMEQNLEPSNGQRGRAKKNPMEKRKTQQSAMAQRKTQQRMLRLNVCGANRF